MKSAIRLRRVGYSSQRSAHGGLINPLAAVFKVYIVFRRDSISHLIMSHIKTSISPTAPIPPFRRRNPPRPAAPIPVCCPYRLCPSLKESQKHGYLQKPNLDGELGVNELASSLERIKQSDVVILFGLSYGESDFSIWLNLIEAVKHQPMLKIIFVGYYESPPVVQGAIMGMKLKNKERNRFAQKICSQFPSFSIDKYVDRILVAGDDYYKNPNEQMVYSDPFALRWFGEKFVHGF